MQRYANKARPPLYGISRTECGRLQNFFERTNTENQRGDSIWNATNNNVLRLTLNRYPYAFRTMERGNLRFLVLIIFYIFYLSIGAGIFSSIEGPLEQRLILDLRQKRDAFLARHPCLKDDDLEEFISAVLSASDQGVSAIRNVSDVPNWGFGSAIFFAGTVITTIGVFFPVLHRTNAITNSIYSFNFSKNLFLKLDS